MKSTLFVPLLILFTCSNIFAQDPHRFDSQITAFAELSAEAEEVVVFTGSSSIRFWGDLRDDCQDYETINTGFGGSHMSDLLYFLDETVLRFEPSSVFIYEGDNDLAAQKEPKAILETAKERVFFRI